MLTQQEYSDVVFRALRANEVLTQSLRGKEALGCFPHWNTAECQSLKIKSGQWSLIMGDLSSDASVDIYNQLLDIGSTFSGSIAVDPNAQPPAGTTINVTNLVNFNQGKILFNNVSTLTLSNYNLTYFPIYGNDPILSVVFDDQFGDFQYTPTYTYATPGDPSSAITQIDYDFVIPKSGYLSISGPGQITGSGGSGGAVQYTFTQGALLFDGTNMQWYLPLVLPTGKNPIFTTVNGVSISATYDTTFSPARLYAFADSSITQNIVVSVI